MITAAIQEVREYLRAEFIDEGCIEEPCLGCYACNVVDLDRQLHALQNFIGEE